jgi:hypothetical protein
LIRDVRIILHSSHDGGGYIVNITNEDAYVFYPRIYTGDYIAPKGYRPVPLWVGDAKRIRELQDLYMSLRYAVVRPNLKQASSFIQKHEYMFLSFLAWEYVEDQVLYQSDMMRYTHLKHEQILETRSDLNRKLKHATQNRWTIYYQPQASRVHMESGIVS